MSRTAESHPTDDEYPVGWRIAEGVLAVGWITGCLVYEWHRMPAWQHIYFVIAGAAFTVFGVGCAWTFLSRERRKR